MSMRPDLQARLARQLQIHQRLFDPIHEPRNQLHWLKPLQQWQAQRLQRSFARFLHDPKRHAAANFFLTDVYGERDFSQRDADIAKVIPKMQRLLPIELLVTIADGIELAALSHALDLHMAAALQGIATVGAPLDTNDYSQAYRAVGHRRLRAHQIALISGVGQGLAAALATPGVGMLLRVSSLPARAAGLGELQSFLERGFAAFAALGDARAFLMDIQYSETRVMQQLFAGAGDPFA
jgi:hypothetical protein